MALTTVAGRGEPVPREKELSYAVVVDPTRLPCPGTSYLAVRTALFRTFGDFPIRLDKHQAGILVAMAAVAGDGARPYELLREALLKFGAIEIRD